MILFYIITLIVLSALGFVFWLIWKECQDEEKPKKEETVTAAGLLDRLGFNSAQTPKPDSPQKISNFFNQLFNSKSIPTTPEKITAAPRVELPASGTAAMRLDNTNIEKVDDEVEQSIKNDELEKESVLLKEKIEKLEKILLEKSQEMEKISKEIEQERRHRKEFNKVKDILEKEIKEAKDESKRYRAELNSSKSEAQTYINRISQLEAKIKTLEKESQADSKEFPEQTEIPQNTVEAPEDSQIDKGEGSPSAEEPADQQESPVLVEKSEENIMTISADNSLIEEGREQTKQDETENNPALSLNLKPVSNLEENYELEAAPKQIYSTSSIPINNDPSLTSDAPEVSEQVQIDEVSGETANSIDEQKFEISVPVQNIEDPQKQIVLDQIQTEKPNSIEETIKPKELTGTEKDETSYNTNDQGTDNSDHVLSQQLIQQEEKQDPVEKIDEDKSNKNEPDHIHLGPDIFKDIEEQFRKIEKEMNITDDSETIELDEKQEEGKEDDDKKDSDENI